MHDESADLPSHGLHGAVVHEIGVRILRGDLMPGDPLATEDELGRDLPVSRTVLREATKVVAASGSRAIRPVIFDIFWSPLTRRLDLGRAAR